MVDRNRGDLDSRNFGAETSFLMVESDAFATGAKSAAGRARMRIRWDIGMPGG